MLSDDVIRQGRPPVDSAIQELLASTPDFDPRRRQIEELQEPWLRRPPEPDNTKETAP
jgi:hypothetical protein